MSAKSIAPARRDRDVAVAISSGVNLARASPARPTVEQQLPSYANKAYLQHIQSTTSSQAQIKCSLYPTLLPHYHHQRLCVVGRRGTPHRKWVKCVARLCDFFHRVPRAPFQGSPDFGVKRGRFGRKTRAAVQSAL